MITRPPSEDPTWPECASPPFGPAPLVSLPRWLVPSAPSWSRTTSAFSAGFTHVGHVLELSSLLELSFWLLVGRPSWRLLTLTAGSTRDRFMRWSLYVYPGEGLYPASACSGAARALWAPPGLCETLSATGKVRMAARHSKARRRINWPSTSYRSDRVHHRRPSAARRSSASPKRSSALR